MSCHNNTVEGKLEDKVEGETPVSTKSRVLEAGAAMTQASPQHTHIRAPYPTISSGLHARQKHMRPPQRFPRLRRRPQAHGRSKPLLRTRNRRYVFAQQEAGSSTNPPPDVRQCILYDSPGPNARLIGIEYMITPKLYADLDPDERRLWHSHVFEVKSGMLIMPQPSPLVPAAAWERAENAEMEQVVTLYGKVYHLWQVDRGDKLPLGEPKLMTSFTEWGQLDEKKMDERDERMGGDWRRKKEARAYIEEPEIHPDADQAWKKK